MAEKPLSRGPPAAGSDLLIVAIGASAGGLDACRNFFEALSATADIAFILIQHLDPHHDSMLVELLAGHTPLKVQQAVDGTLVQRDNIYIIPPGAYLAIAGGVLYLSKPQERHGARLPFDFLLRSLAKDHGARAIAIVLSGSGADGSLGLRAIKEAGGLVIAQDPEEAGFNGMPVAAIATGAVDLVLRIAKMPAAIATFSQRSVPDTSDDDWMPNFIDLLRAQTGHDFTLYKPGTLQRRIERRMAMASVKPQNAQRYLAILESDPEERERLAKDLLINVTSFFRDKTVFDRLAADVIPDLVRNAEGNHVIRIWVAGCSTGEETYSLAILFREAITAARSQIKLQVFGSDVDADAVAHARDGLYPDSVASDIPAEWLGRFFTKEDHHYRVSPELRSVVVFTVQDILADPPFSRLDFVSCRNLLIYLRPEAQARVIGLLHFALREGGVLLLGTSETVGNATDRFTVVSKAERVYRRIGRSRPGEFSFLRAGADSLRPTNKPTAGEGLSRRTMLADLCRHLVMETYAPAAVLINRKHELLYSLGPTDRYLHVAPGPPSHDLLSMVRQSVRTKLRAGIQLASRDDTRVVVAGGQTVHDGTTSSFNIAVQPVRSDNEDLFLVCFIEDAKAPKGPVRSKPADDQQRVAALEQELEATRTELQGAIHNLEISSEEQKAINEEALSVQEEYQSTNEELLTSKEELQSLNEELTALNSQLQETLERQRTTANDLQNVLYSTNVATLFLDLGLNIRFFTPATRALFAIIPSDLGRPLGDLHSLAADSALLPDARTVLTTLTPVEREIEAQSGACYIRRVLPYRTQDNQVEGVVITFDDITERRSVADQLGVAKRQAEQANAAKSRFLAAASHDLRQPLQTLALIQGLLAKVVDNDRARKLIVRMDETLGGMAGMLNTLLDINQIEAGTIHAEMVDFPVNDLLEQLRDEFIYHAQAKGLALHVIPCGLSVSSDPRLLEQMIRNLLSNAIKYTAHGKILLGCRRGPKHLSIEVWDTGIGIPETQQDAIFDEYHQIDNPARERSRGLGLGLSIVQRLGSLLGHPIHVRSRPGIGSVFSIDVGLVDDTSARQAPRLGMKPDGGDIPRNTGAILIVEDDPDVRDLLETFLKGEGNDTRVAADGATALALVTSGIIRPDLILADFNLPNGMDGTEVVAKIRKNLNQAIPAIILTGDIADQTFETVSLEHCVQLNKPVKLREMVQSIQRLLPSGLSAHKRPTRQDDAGARPVIYVVDDDDGIRGAIRSVLDEDSRTVEDFASCEAFLAGYTPGRPACLVIDAYLPAMCGMELLHQLAADGHAMPTIMITGSSDVAMAVSAMKAGAADFIEKPISREDLLASVDRAVERALDAGKLSAWRADAAAHIAGLTSRQREIMAMVLAGTPSKNIAADLGISQRTVENHRASIMRKTGARSLPALARLAVAASG